MQTTGRAQSTLDAKVIKETILAIARDFSERGPGWAQESVVLLEAAQRLKIGGEMASHQGTVADQQAVLTCWHDLFREGVLSWGYNLDNPGSPCFHFRIQ